MIDIDTLTAIVGIQLLILTAYGLWSWQKIQRDERDKKKLAKWLEMREDRLSRERFWQ